MKWAYALKNLWWGIGLAALSGVLLALILFGPSPALSAFASPALFNTSGGSVFLPFVFQPVGTPPPPAQGQYIVLGWNDLGMHCYNRDFSDLAVLPPYNNLFVQVVQRGDPPKIVTTGLTVSYSFPENTYSVGKSNFWQYAPKLFGVTLPNNIGLTGRGLSGNMTQKGSYFTADGIPLTEYNDSDWNNRQPFQLADIVVKDSTGKELARNQVVAPVSTEMRCDRCHSDGQREGIATGKVETNILTLHDKEEGTNLMSRRPVLCAECHSSNALGAPGTAGVPSLSRAMHSQHAEVFQGTQQNTDTCYNCHPGPTTKCLRDVMSTKHGMNCINCHGDMSKVSQNANPWLNEPRCDSCHTDPKFKQNQALYRQSTGHGGLFCEACHDSTHAIAPSTQPRDAIKFMNLQGAPGPINKCTVCHLTAPASGGPHS